MRCLCSGASLEEGRTYFVGPGLWVFCPFARVLCLGLDASGPPLGSCAWSFCTFVFKLADAKGGFLGATVVVRCMLHKFVLHTHATKEPCFEDCVWQPVCVAYRVASFGVMTFGRSFLMQTLSWAPSLDSASVDVWCSVKCQNKNYMFQFDWKPISDAKSHNAKICVLTFKDGCALFTRSCFGT